MSLELTSRQKQIIHIVKTHMPISGDHIAEHLSLSKATLRPDLTLLTTLNLLIAKPKVGYYYNSHFVSPFYVDHLRDQLVEEVMARPVLLSAESSLQEALNTLFTADADMLYITHQRALVGVVSQKDLLKFKLVNTPLDQVSVTLAMSRHPNLYTIAAEDTVANAVEMLTLHKVDSLPVLQWHPEHEQHEVVGQFSKTVVTRLLADILSPDFE